MNTSWVVLLATLLGLAAATEDSLSHTALNKTFLNHQKKLLELLWHVSQPLFDPQQLELANNYKVEDNLADFKTEDVAGIFITHYQVGFFKKQGEPFSPYNKVDLFQAELLVGLLLNAKDFDAFIKVSTWARAHLNEGLFAYSFGIAKLARYDTRHLVLPAAYEIYPQGFVKHEAMKQAYEAYLRGFATNPDKPYVVLANYSGYPYAHNQEELLSYFTEDVVLADYFSYMNLKFPFWLRQSDLGHKDHNRGGDYFYFGVKQLLARYNIERLSNHLPDVESFDYRKPFRIGPNEEVRPNRMLAELTRAYERRLYDAIDLGYVIDTNFSKHLLSNADGTDLFGSAVQGNADSVNPHFYGSYFRSLIAVAAHGDEQSELEHPATSARHPLYYRILKRVSEVLDVFKDRLGPYSRHELEFPGVDVRSFTVDKLVTYFSQFDFELSNGVMVPNAEIGNKLNVVARVHRLTHKPFNYHINITSENDVEATVSVFYSPRYDVYGKPLKFEEARRNIVRLDSFNYNLKAGENVLERSSKSFSFSGYHPLSFSELYKKTVNALNGNEEVHLEDFMKKVEEPDKLTLPKGTRSGLPLRFYVSVLPAEHGADAASLFPFDRPYYSLVYKVPNSAIADVTVFHRNSDEAEAA